MVLALTLATATLAFHPSLRALPSRTVARSTSRSVLPLAAAEVAVAEVPLLTSSNLDAWERIDDVIMGGTPHGARAPDELTSRQTTTLTPQRSSASRQVT